MKCLLKYQQHLKQNAQASSDHHRSVTPVRSPVEYGGMHTHEASLVVPEQYQQLQDILQSQPPYTPIHLCDYTPVSSVEKRKWLHDLKLPDPFVLYSYQHGSFLGTEHFTWRIPADRSLRDKNENAKALLHVTSNIKVYSTWVMHKQFIDKYNHKANISPSVLRAIFRDLCDDSSASESSEQAAVDSHVAKFFLNTENPDPLLDLRILNGQPSSTKFDEFWDELHRFVDEQCVVQERRHGIDHLYLPITISLEDLRETIKSRLPEGAAIPSKVWLCLQFWPATPYACVASRYTGRFNLKFRVQT